MICPEDHAHGMTVTCYRVHRCRCDECRQANNEDTVERRLRAYIKKTSTEDLARESARLAHRASRMAAEVRRRG